MSEFNTYLFSYRFEGEEWGFEIQARSAEEASRRVESMAVARYDGELVSRIPAGFGLVARLLVIVRNRIDAARAAEKAQGGEG